MIGFDLDATATDMPAGVSLNRFRPVSHSSSAFPSGVPGSAKSGASRSATSPRDIASSMATAASKGSRSTFRRTAAWATPLPVA